MTDKLPIERLEELLDIAQIEEESFQHLVSAAILDGHKLEVVWESDLQQWRDHVNAIKELIALRKTEPVAWFKHGPYEDDEKMQAVCYDPLDDDCYSPLIIKP